MDDHSYDDSEPTPEPTPFRPPPPINQPQSKDISTPGLLNQTLFSFSVDGILDDDLAGVSLPSLPPEPPSPISKPPDSLFGDDNSSSKRQFSSSSQHLKATTTPSAMSRASSSRQPPIAEVHLDNEEDTFFDAFEDLSDLG